MSPSSRSTEETPTEGEVGSLPHGSWPSPVTAARLVEGAANVGEVRVDGPDVWWSEQRPGEGGRTQLVRRCAEGTITDLFGPWGDPDGDGSGPGGAGRRWNARTAYLEYGGGAWGVRDGVVVFADWDDQRLHRAEAGAEPTPVSPAPSVPRGFRWSEPVWLDDRWLVAVRESHEPDVVAGHGEAVNELVALPADGSAAEDPSLVRVLWSGADFVHSPAVEAETGRVAWLSWDHPAMPWDGTRLHLARIDRDESGFPVGLVDERVVAGGPAESVVQPGFTAGGDLLYCSDRTGWWNPYRLVIADQSPDPTDASTSVSTSVLTIASTDVSPDGPAVPLIDGGIEAEIGGPLWVGGLRWWAEASDGSILAVARSSGRDRLVRIDGGAATVVEPEGLALTEVPQVVAAGQAAGQAAASDGGWAATVVAAGPRVGPEPILLSGHREPDGPAMPVASLALRPSRSAAIDDAWISSPTAITYPSAEGRVAHGLFYPPNNPSTTGPDGELPPLVVMIHGGPTSHARHRFELSKQFWTTRGFAVVDVDYGGSTGYGRPFRRLLDGRWGIVDVQDAVAAARHLAAEGLVDGKRLAIRGGSAGGFTTLAALCFHDAFAAGASHYGVADLAALAADTHKFESRYLDGLVGRWPEDRELYEQRSPVAHVDGFSAPLLVLQGSEDEVVPPSQAEIIVAALAAKGIAHAYLLFEGEQHGFRRADTIVRALEAELWFYGRVFGFEPADRIDPVPGAVGLAP